MEWGKPRKTLDKRSPELDLNLVPPEYEAGMLTTRAGRMFGVYCDNFIIITNNVWALGCERRATAKKHTCLYAPFFNAFCYVSILVLLLLLIVHCPTVIIFTSLVCVIMFHDFRSCLCYSEWKKYGFRTVEHLLKWLQDSYTNTLS
jgi:hypothetical protein